MTALFVILSGAKDPLLAQSPRPLMPAEYANSAESAWVRKPVLASRVLDDMSDSSTWKLSGTARFAFGNASGRDGRALRVDMNMYTDKPAPGRTRLSSVNLQRRFAGEDWSGYNRLSLWIKADVAGFPMLPLQLVMHNDGAVKVPDRYEREGIHYFSLSNGWNHIVWEIEPLARDRVTMLELGYWVNKMLAAPGDRVGFEIGKIELEKVEPDAHTGWSVATGRISYSHAGYEVGSPKTAFATDLPATTYELVRVDGSTPNKVVLRRPVMTVPSRFGDFRYMEFTDFDTPGRYVLRAGDVSTEPFDIAKGVWKETVWKTINFFYGERCGFAVPGVHGVDHLDWFVTHGDQRISMSGGWHDAGDLSQGTINTGEATYAMFALAERMRGRDAKLEARLIEEARWGLDWVMKVRFGDGYRMPFTNHNLWTNNVVGDADDRTREAKNNPNTNYIAAAAEAIAARVLKSSDPQLAARSLKMAEEDWGFAIVGIEGPSTWTTPAFAATRLELAGIGITASMELYRATGNRKYSDKAAELAKVIVASQQKTLVGGNAFPLSGFFYTGPDRDTLFHQFHRGNDQAPVVALVQLIEALPKHPDAASWRSTVKLYLDYQKRTASTTFPYEVLPAYVYRLGDEKEVPDSGALHGATREAYRAQVLSGLPMGGEWYLRDFPVWFARRGNFGVLLSQAKALSAASRLLHDRAGLELAQKQVEWIVGRNPFTQSMMWGEGYDWAQQYSVSSGDIVGSLPVGMQSRGDTDLPYWPSQNMYVYKEVWVHPSARWLWIMADLLAP